MREHITDRAHGIDVSHHQGEFILEKTWGQIDFAIAKFGEGYNSPYNEPYTFEANYSDFLPLWDDGCARVPIRGIYFYQRSGYSWQKQAELLLERVERLNAKPHMIWCDVEDGHNVIDKSFLADTLRIMDYWRDNTKYTIGLYTNKSTLQYKVLPIGKAAYGPGWLEQMKQYPLWYAQYWFQWSPDKQPGTLTEWSNWDLWQYTDSGADKFETRDGVRMRRYGTPDVNVYNGSVAEMRTWLKIPDDLPNSPIPEAPEAPIPGKVTLIVPQGTEVEVRKE